jgi:hypothetical protein
MARRALSLFALFALLAGLAAPVAAEIVVIVHPESNLRSLSTQQVSDLYLGRLRAIDGTSVQLLDLADDTSLRMRFFKSVNGMDLPRVNAYWARLQFSGNVLAPLQIANPDALREAVSRNRRAIGYIDASQVTPQVRAVLALKD